MAFEDLYELGALWEEVRGIEDQKRFVDEYLIEPLTSTSSFQAPKHEKKSLLLYGPPGVGKSYLLKSMARKIGQQTVFRVFASDLISKWQDTLKLMEEIQEKLLTLDRPCIIIVEEMETLKHPECSSWQKYPEAKSLIMKLLNGEIKGCAATICVSNNPETLDPDIMKAFVSKLFITLPDIHARCGIFKANISSNMPKLTDLDFNTVAAQTDGFTGADLSCLVRDVLMEPVRRIQRATHFRKVQDHKDGHQIEMLTPCDACEEDAIQMVWSEVDYDKLSVPPVTMEDVLKCLAKAKPSISTEDMKKFQEFDRN